MYNYTTLVFVVPHLEFYDNMEFNIRTTITFILSITSELGTSHWDIRIPIFAKNATTKFVHFFLYKNSHFLETHRTLLAGQQVHKYAFKSGFQSR